MLSGSSEAFLDNLRHSLAKPPVPVDIHTLAQLFRIETVTVTTLRPPDFEDYPDLVLRVRGALGNMIHAMGPRPHMRPAINPYPRAWDVLQAELVPGLPKPMVLQVDVSGKEICIHAHLIGHAAFWLPDVEAALVAACDGGITLSNESRVKAVMPVIAASRKITPGFLPPKVSISQSRLHFITPLRLRSGTATKVSLPSLAISLANRVKGLAAWHGFALELDWNKFHKEAWEFQLIADTLVPYHWERGSQRASRRIPVLGFLGKLAISGNLQTLIPMLQISEFMNIGSHAALGLGRFKLVLLP